MPWHAYVMCVSQLRVLTMRLNIRLQYFVILPSVKHWTLEAQWLLTLSFLCCPIMWLYVLSYVLWCPYTKGWSSLPQVACWRARFLFTLFVFAYVQVCPTHMMLCFCFCLSSSCVLCVSSFIAPSIFSTVDLVHTIR
jgi:hypothetical protein